MKKTFLSFIFLGISLFSLAQNSGDLENIFYLRFGYSQPTKSYFGIDDDTFWEDFSRRGGTFELGHIFMLNRIQLSDGLRIGINADYAEFSYHELTNKSEDLALGLFKISSKIGPTISYSPVTDLVFDVFIKVKIPWIGVVADVPDFDDTFLGTMGLGYSTGFNVRYRFIMAGFEFNMDQMKFENIDEPGDYLGSFNMNGPESDKTPTPTFSFTFGFCF
ncbi:MAG: hypothetical protein GY790_13415 [Bacteroidetes bacterium]|nr:hypothetical protein [Bacteroidota bacterium]